MRITLTIERIEAMARNLDYALTAFPRPNYSQRLEILARTFGYREYTDLMTAIARHVKIPGSNDTARSAAAVIPANRLDGFDERDAAFERLRIDGDDFWDASDLPFAAHGVGLRAALVCPFLNIAAVFDAWPWLHNLDDTRLPDVLDHLDTMISAADDSRALWAANFDQPTVADMLTDLRQRPGYDALDAALTCIATTPAPTAQIFMHRAQAYDLIGKRRPDTLNTPVFYECGICGETHPITWNGDCREDAHRWSVDALERVHGEHFVLLPMPPMV